MVGIPNAPTPGRRFHELHRASREKHLAQVDALEAAGHKHVEWRVSAEGGDCRFCRSRHCKKFTLAAARKLLAKDYCCSTIGGFQRNGCRCSIVAVGSEMPTSERALPMRCAISSRPLPGGGVHETLEVSLAPETSEVLVMQLVRAATKGGEAFSDVEIAREIVSKPDLMAKFRELVGEPGGTRCVEVLQRIVSALIDTGATCSAIRPEIAAFLRLPDGGPGTFAGTGPVTHGRFVEARLVYHADGGVLLLRDARLAVVTMEAAMLLGMAELMDGTFTVDGEARTWRWDTWREGP